MDHKRDELGEQDIVSLKREIFLLFSELMDKFKAYQVVSDEEILALSQSYYRFTCLLGNPEGEDVQEQVKRFLPPLELINQCFSIQRALDITIDSKSSSAKSDIETDIHLLAEMRALFEENPIKNLKALLTLYEEYIHYVDADNLSNTIESFETAKENQELLHYLDVESRREKMTIELEKTIALYDEKYEQPYSTDTISHLETLYNALQSSEFEPYLTRQQSQKIDEIKREVDSECQVRNKLHTPKTNRGIAFVSDSPEPSKTSLTGSTTLTVSSSSSSFSIFRYLSSDTRTPIISPTPQSKVKTLGSPSPFRSPLETNPKWRQYNASLIPDARLDDAQAVVSRRLDFDGNDNGNNGSQAASFVTISLSQQGDGNVNQGGVGVVSGNKASTEKKYLKDQRTNKNKIASSPHFSAAFWILAAATVSAAVAAILLLVLASCFTMTVAGWGCVGLSAFAGAGLLFVCRNQIKDMAVGLVPTNSPVGAPG